MIRNYLKIALRNLFKQKVYSSFNLVGLALGLSCGLLLTLHIKEELSYEKDFPKHDRIFRMVTTEWSKSQPPLAGELKNYFPEIKSAGRFSGRGSQITNYGPDKQAETTGFFADSSVVEIFDLKPIHGNAFKALKEPSSVVITKSMAEKFFGKQDPIGKKLTFDNKEELWVRAVVDDLPINSHLKFDYLASMPTFYKNVPENWTSNRGWMFGWTYILLKDPNDAPKIEKRLKDFYVKFYQPNNADEKKQVAEFAATARLQPLTDIHLKSNLIQEMGPNSSILYVYIFIAVEILILIIACVNFINLFTTQALRRAKEVGMRKALGAKKAQVITQFLGEAFILTTIAGVLAIGLYRLVIPFYNEMAGKELSGWEILQPANLSIMVTMILFVGLLSGVFPALFIAKFDPIASLKSDKLPKSSATLLRKSLIVLQFVVSGFLISSTILIYQQMKLFKNKELGFDKEQVVAIKLYGGFKEKVLKNAAVFKNELTRNPNVIAVGQSSNLIGDDLSVESVTPLNPPANKEFPSFKVSRIDEDYLTVLNIPLKEGRNFSRQFNDSASFIINEKAAKALELKNPVGSVIVNNTMGLQGKVVGVVKDYNFASLHSQVEPLVLEYKPAWSGNMLVKIAAGNVPQTIDFLKTTVEKVAPNTIFSYTFLDERMASLYKKEDTMSQILNAFSGLAIIISCLGLFGVVAHESKLRTKEIGIRKVLGASVPNLVVLLSSSFLKLVIIGIVIATPIAWYAMNQWLQDFEYRIELRWWVFAIAGLFTIGVALLTVSFQSIKAALMDPVKSLKTE
ncbi:ABC transporter permease [Runella sp.]|uniref:ABC transporter permease n=1 Tax=Runella sp. TaxID=1960881 RepID=UPI003D139728